MLTPASRVVLSEVAAVLIEQPFIPVEVEVEVKTFSEATPGLNHGLSTQQAEAIFGVLLAGGVDADRMVAVGLGSASDPAGDRSALVLVDTADPDLAARLRATGGQLIGFDQNNALTENGRTLLDQVGEHLDTDPDSSISLVGYAYADSPTVSHDRSHAVLAAAAYHLFALGFDQSRVSTVGLGATPIDFGAESEVEFEVGFPAAMFPALRQVATDRI